MSGGISPGRLQGCAPVLHALSPGLHGDGDDGPRTPCSIRGAMNFQIDRLHSKQKELYSEIGRDVFLNRLIRQLGEQEPQQDGLLFKRVEATVQEFLDAIESQSGGGFKGHPKPTGSRSEGAHTSGSDDYDFLIVLDKFDVTALRGDLRGVVKNNDLTCFTRKLLPLDAQVETPKHFKTSELDRDAPRYISYFDLTKMEGPVIKRLNASSFIVIFKHWLDKVITSEKAIKTNGPAITVWCLVDGTRVKIDMTLAIKVGQGDLRLKDADQSDPEKMLLRERAQEAWDYCYQGQHKTQEQRTYYVIATGDIWRLTAANQERDHMESASEVSKTVYRALKKINTDHCITDSGEDPIMSSYPMKISIIKGDQNEMRREKTKQYKWYRKVDPNITEYSEKCMSVLYNVDSSKDSLRSAFIKDDAVFRPGQKSYLEARRIALYLRGIRRLYAVHGLLQTLLTLTVFIPNLINAVLLATLVRLEPGNPTRTLNATVVTSDLTLTPDIPLTSKVTLTSRTLPEDYMRDVVLFGLHPLSIVAICACAIGFMTSLTYSYCLTSKYCSIYKQDFGDKRPKMSTIYWLHRWIMVYYLLFGVLGLVPAAHYTVWMRCFDQWPRRKSLSGQVFSHDDLCISRHLADGLCVVSMVTTLVTCAAIFVHLCGVMVVTRCRANRHKYGWVFLGLSYCREFPWLDCCHREVPPGEDGGEEGVGVGGHRGEGRHSGEDGGMEGVGSVHSLCAVYRKRDGRGATGSQDNLEVMAPLNGVSNSGDK